MSPTPETPEGPDIPEGPDSPRGFRVQRLLPLLVIAAGIVAFFALGFDRYLSFSALSEHRQGLQAWTDENPISAMVSYTMVYALVVAFSIPGAVWLTIAGGFIFGIWSGTICTVLGATIGACAVFLAARFAFADFFHAKAGPALRRMESGFRENAASYLLFLRLVPVFPFWLVNLAPAFFGIPLGKFALWTLIGIIPGTLVYVLVGNGIGAYIDRGEAPSLAIIFEPQYLAPILGLAVLSLVPIAVKRFRRSPALVANSDGSDVKHP